MDDSKEIDMSRFDGKSSFSANFWNWVDDNNPLSYAAQRWFQEKDIFHPLRVCRKIKNIVRWIPILWNDVDWDYSSLYLLVRSKIRFMRQHQLECGNHTDCEEVAGQMKIAEDALSRLIEDDYAKAEWDAHISKFPRSKPEWIDLPDGMKQMAPVSQEHHDSVRSITDKEERDYRADLDLFSKTFSEHVRKWWD